MTDMVTTYIRCLLCLCSKRRFKEKQATIWWDKNKDRVLRRYSPHAAGETSSIPAAPPEDETDGAAS